MPTEEPAEAIDVNLFCDNDQLRKKLLRKDEEEKEEEEEEDDDDDDDDNEEIDDNEDEDKSESDEEEDKYSNIGGDSGAEDNINKNEVVGKDKYEGESSEESSHSKIVFSHNEIDNDDIFASELDRKFIKN